MSTRRGRTAPDGWGTWPPTQETLTGVCKRAAQELARRVKADTGLVLLIVPKTPAEVDRSFAGEETEIVVGEVRAVERHRSWSIIWSPATDTGRVHPNGTYDWRA